MKLFLAKTKDKSHFILAGSMLGAFDLCVEQLPEDQEVIAIQQVASDVIQMKEL